MTVKIVTDSGADIPEEILEDLGIETVPYRVEQGFDSFRDGIDITAEEIYRRLEQGIDLKTAAAPPKDFIELYERYGKDGVVSIQLSEKLSATYKSAFIAKGMVEEEKGYQIEVIDSESVVMGIGLLAIMAAKAAKQGKGLEEIVKMVNGAIPKIHLIAVLNTLEYAKKSGRLGKVAVLLKPFLKPVLVLKNGAIKLGIPVLTSKKQERLLGFAQSFSNVKEIAVEYATAKDREEAESLLDRIKLIYPEIPLYLSQISPVLGVHAGPGTIVVVVRQG